MLVKFVEIKLPAVNEPVRGIAIYELHMQYSYPWTETGASSKSKLLNLAFVVKIPNTCLDLMLAPASIQRQE